MARREHVKAQLDWQRSIAYWRRFDHAVPVPWWIAAAAYPIMIGVRTVVWTGAMPVYALSSAAEWHNRPEDGPPSGAASFILVLRTFGNDGSLLADTRQLRGRELVPRVRTLESIVGASAKAAGVESVVGFHNAAASAIPKGVRYFGTPDESWEAEFRRLVWAASAVVLFSTPDIPIGESFRQEIRFIKAEGLQDRALVVSPPDLDARARSTTNEILDLLTWPTLDNMPLVCYLGDDRRLKVHPSIGLEDDSLARRYEKAISMGLSLIVRRTTWSHDPDAGIRSS